MDELRRELIHMGLSEKEACVYLASLELGSAVVQDIAKKANVNRATTYVCIEALAARGLMSTFVKGKKRYFSGETPERLLSIVRLQRLELEEKEKEVESIIPRLMALFNADGEKPQIRYLEGPQGIRTVRQMFATTEGEFIQIIPVDEVKNMDAILEGHDEHFETLRKNGGVGRVLALTASAPDQLRPLPGTEIRAIPPEKFPLHGEISVRGNTIFMYSYKSNLLGLIITSKELSAAVRALFELAWEGSAAYPSKKFEQTKA